MKRINLQRLLLIIVMAILLCSCNRQKSGDGRTWEKADQDLWISNTGDLAIKAFGASETESRNEMVFIDTFSNRKTLKSVIDRMSFAFLGSSFYKDKYHVYNHHDTSDGGTFLIEARADPSTFVIVGDCYAKDKNHVHLENFGELGIVDYKSFKTKKGIGCFERDRVGIYNWDQKVDSSHPDFKSITKELN